MGTSLLLSFLLAAGPWTMGRPSVTDPTLPPVAPQEVPVGTWLGTLEVPGGARLRMVFHIRPSAGGGLSATLDSPDQGAAGLPVSEITFKDGHLRLYSAVVAGTFEGDLTQGGKALDGQWIQGGLEIALTLERTEEKVKTPARPQEPRGPVPYGQEEVRYAGPDGGPTLAGTLTLPLGGGSHPAVVLVSGSGPQDRNETVFGHRPFLVLADHLTRQGIAVLRYDDRGVEESEGDFGAATTEVFVSDALAGVEFLKTRGDIDAGAIGLIGHSEGGLVAPIAAVRSRDVAFIVMLAGPGVTGEDIVLEQAALIARASGATDEAVERNRRLQRRLFEVIKQEPDPEVAKPLLEEMIRSSLAEMTEEERKVAGLTGAREDQVVQAQVQAVNSPWFRFFLTYDPVPTLRRLTAPVLALNGEMDLQVSSKQNLPVIEAALKEGGNPDATVRELPGLNHLFQHATTGSPNEYTSIEETISPDVLTLISDWILERVSRRD